MSDAKTDSPCQTCPSAPCVEYGVIDGREQHSVFVRWREILVDYQQRYPDPVKREEQLAFAIYYLEKELEREREKHAGR